VEPGDVFAGLPFDRAIDLVPTTPFEMVGDSSKLADFLESGGSATEYLRCMDREGIDAAVLYPSIGLFVPFQPGIGTAESAAACRSYNEWIAGYCATAPSRLTGVGLVPLADVDDAVAVLGQVLDLGLPGVMVRPNHLYGRSLGDAAYDRLYAAIAEAGAVLSVHEGLGLTGGPTIGMDRSQKFAVRHAMSHPMEQMAAMASLMLEGTLERHPGLRVAFLESGTGWLTWWLGRLDEHAEWMAETECKELSLRPSEYFRRQCVISSDPEDPLAGWTVANHGADHVVWASDFPHPDAKYPEALAAFCEHASEQGIGAADLRALLWDTPVSFYRLEERFAL
jgi:predicted TIM-barrel fold metal-dependent hydrolase